MNDPQGIYNLRHALRDDCHDPDCELHNPEVGIEEGVVSLTNLAFFTAGAFDLMGLFQDAYDVNHDVEESFRVAIAEFRDVHAINNADDRVLTASERIRQAREAQS